ncbi:hypothetical protein J4573_42680 [Actinomadura barringtoniae]|uniref:Uncharacterized protein n=1 Tax=Actinomadura barringtoniae TaxID=1427535 RepID=A0A939PPK0_9ACTN|nr:hypothetical protein [Actinomadura barringtoniae]MBO2453858.1 hypothetical protein [Actinomadura barringtoniae]
MTDTYEETCARLAVEERPEGWALWNTWAEDDLKVTMVVSAVETTEGLLMNWANGRNVLPVMPFPAQIAQVHAGWIATMVFSPYGKKKLGLQGHKL